MDILILLLILIFVWGIKFKKEINEEYLSLKTCQALRGLLAIVIIYHHLSAKTSDGLFFEVFTDVGFLAVAIFFFFSGYGLQKRHITDNNYKNKFFKKRIPTILFPYMFMTVICWAVNAVGGTIYSVKDIFFMMLKGETIVNYSWYVINILLFYLLFYLLMKIFGNKYTYMVLIAGLSCVVWIYLCKHLGWGRWWYNSTHLLVIGMIWATYEHKIIKFIKKYYYMVFTITILLFLFCVGLSYKISTEKINLIIQLFSSSLFTINVLLFSLKFQIGNVILNFFGKISYEIYLLHGLIINILRSDLLYIKNDLLWSVLVLLGSTIFAFIFHKICEVILSKYRKLIT